MNAEDARILNARASAIAAEANSLASVDRSWGSTVHPLADGWLVLSGAGMWVNQAVDVGVEECLTAADVESLVALCEAAGVAPTIEVTPSTLPETVVRLRTSGFTHDPEHDVVLLTRSVDGPTVDFVDHVEVLPVRTEADLCQWQEVSAGGWAHTTAPDRRASDAFAAAVHALDGGHLYIAREYVAGEYVAGEYVAGEYVAGESTSGRSLGCAAMTLRDGVAILFGMSTLPADRRRGVQGALLCHRLHHAAEMGCDLAATTTVAGGVSERNLRRHGFEPRTTIKTFTRA